MWGENICDFFISVGDSHRHPPPLGFVAHIHHWRKWYISVRAQGKWKPLFSLQVHNPWALSTGLNTRLKPCCMVMLWGPSWPVMAFSHEHLTWVLPDCEWSAYESARAAPLPPAPVPGVLRGFVGNLPGPAHWGLREVNPRRVPGENEEENSLKMGKGQEGKVWSDPLKLGQRSNEGIPKSGLFPGDKVGGLAAVLQAHQLLHRQ